MRPRGAPLARRLACALAALAAAAGCASLRGGGGGAAPDAEGALEAATRRWQGNHVRLATPLELGRKAGEWTSSGSVYVAKDQAGGEDFYFQLLVEGRDAMADAFEGDLLRADTAFVADGWQLKDPESRKGPYLELRFADQPAARAPDASRGRGVHVGRARRHTGACARDHQPATRPSRGSSEPSRAPNDGPTST